MPTYDYQCRACGTVNEVIHSMLEDGPSVCELCGGSLRRVIHPAGIIFKGSGFYRNDSRASASSSIASGEKKSEAGNGSAKESSSSSSSSESAKSDGGPTPSSSASKETSSN